MYDYLKCPSLIVCKLTKDDNLGTNISRLWLLDTYPGGYVRPQSRVNWQARPYDGHQISKRIPRAGHAADRLRGRHVSDHQLSKFQIFFPLKESTRALWWKTIIYKTIFRLQDWPRYGRCSCLRYEEAARLDRCSKAQRLRHVRSESYPRLRYRVPRRLRGPPVATAEEQQSHLINLLFM